jgi:hypothetical protein
MTRKNHLNFSAKTKNKNHKTASKRQKKPQMGTLTHPLEATHGKN